MRTTLRNRYESVKTIIDFFYPPMCVFCRRLLSQHELEQADHSPFCDQCREFIPPVAENYCQKCGAEQGKFVATTAECSHCKQDKFAFSSVVSLGTYDGKYQQMVVESKPPMHLSLATALSELLFERHANVLQTWEPDVVIPIPNHWWSHYVHPNSCPEVMARTLARKLDVPVASSGLSKTKRTAPQASLSPSERRKNLRNVFHSKKSKQVSDKKILIVDDVLTTGSTAHEAARALKKAGANDVFVAVLARGIGIRAN